MLQLNTLKSITKARKRRGRGGDRGGTSGRGHKGQKARTAGKSEIKAYFEGGQMPLSRRIPRRGFNNPLKKDVKIVSLQALNDSFNDGQLVNKESLKAAGLIKGHGRGGLFLVKVLANGELAKKLTVQVDLISDAAKQAVERAGGSVQLIKEMNSGNTAA